MIEELRVSLTASKEGGSCRGAASTFETKFRILCAGFEWWFYETVFGILSYNERRFQLLLVLLLGVEAAHPRRFHILGKPVRRSRRLNIDADLVGGKC
jgi:hypothetical protein